MRAARRARPGVSKGAGGAADTRALQQCVRPYRDTRAPLSSRSTDRDSPRQPPTARKPIRASPPPHLLLTSTSPPPLLLTSSSNSSTSPPQAGVPNITELDLRSNSLTDLPEELAELRTLKSVKLNYNKFEKLPVGRCKLNR
jgi:Leucine-rich repeat (LRR) protein